MKQLLSNYDNSLFKTNFIENITPLLCDVNFLSSTFLFFLPSPLFSSLYPDYITPHGAPPPPERYPTLSPLIHIPTNTHLRLISSHTHTTLPPTHPTQHLWLITSKEDAISPKRDPLKQIPAGDPNCSNLTSQTDPLSNTTNLLLAHVKTFCTKSRTPTLGQQFQYLRLRGDAIADLSIWQQCSQNEP